MSKDELLLKLQNLEAREQNGGSYHEAVECLLEHIDDEDVTSTFGRIQEWNL